MALECPEPLLFCLEYRWAGSRVWVTFLREGTQEVLRVLKAAGMLHQIMEGSETEDEPHNITYSRRHFLVHI